jgi:hypothetical protein
MGLFEDGLKGLGPSLLMSVGAVIAAPVVIPAVMGGLRPLAKTAIRGYLYLSDSLRESIAEAGEQVSDLVAEAKAEAGAEERNGSRARRGDEEATGATARRSRRRAR